MLPIQKKMVCLCVRVQYRCMCVQCMYFQDVSNIFVLPVQFALESVTECECVLKSYFLGSKIVSGTHSECPCPLSFRHFIRNCVQRAHHDRLSHFTTLHNVLLSAFLVQDKEPLSSWCPFACLPGTAHRPSQPFMSLCLSSWYRTRTLSALAKRRAFPLNFLYLRISSAEHCLIVSDFSISLTAKRFCWPKIQR